MAELLFRNDTAFFRIITQDVNEITKKKNEKDFNATINISDHVLSFQVEEEVNQIMRGSLSFIDNEGLYSRLMPFMSSFSFQWGYNTRSINQKTQLEIKTKIPDAIITTGISRKLQGRIMQPSWDMSNDGKIIYTISFLGIEYEDNLFKVKVFEKMQRQQLVKLLFEQLNIKTMWVLFDNPEQMTEQTQMESPLKLLNKLAYEWKAFLKIGINAAGQPEGYFISNTLLGSPMFKSQMSRFLGVTGSSLYLNYGFGEEYPNVISANVTRNVGESGQGDNTTVMIVNGQPIVTKYLAETVEVTSLKLNDARLENYLKSIGANKESEIAQQILNAKNYESKIGNKTVAWFYDTVSQTTAPQGFGWSINAEIFGEPCITPPMLVRLGNGFPYPIRYENLLLSKGGGELNQIYLKKVTHKIDMNGYRCSIELGDCLTVYGTLGVPL